MPGGGGAATARRSDARAPGKSASALPPLIFARASTSSTKSPDTLAESYHSDLVDAIKDRRLSATRSGRLTVHLAREFGFCYGVDRAVDYAYQARKRFPDRPVVPDRRDHPQPARQRSAARAGHPLPDAIPASRSTRSTPDDVVILPAFGVTIGAAARRSIASGCTLVDTTCGSVLERLEERASRYAADGFTSVIHGKLLARGNARHGVAGAARRRALPGRAQPRRSRRPRADYIRGTAATAAAFLARFEHAVLAGFDPDRDLAARRLRQPDDDAELGIARDRRDVPRGDAGSIRRGRDAATGSARSTRSAAPRRIGRTPSSALLDYQPLDLMVVIGGYNSSNTSNLARICEPTLPTYHVAEPDCLSFRTARFVTSRWAPRTRAGRRPAGCRRAATVVIGLTSGASTPDNLVGARSSGASTHLTNPSR